MEREPNKNERVSLANAIQLLRDAGYDDKANELDELLQIGGIVVERLEPGTQGTALKDPFAETEDEALLDTITISPTILPRRRSLDRCDAELIELAATLLHECTHLDCYDELAAWGTELTALKRFRKNLDDLFEDCDDPALRVIETTIDVLIEEARTIRCDIAKKGGPGYGGEKPAKPKPEPKPEPKGEKPPKKFFFISYPARPMNAGDALLADVGRAIWTYREKIGKFPDGSNAEMIATLIEAGLCPVLAEELNESGEVVDDDGRPLVYRSAGKLFRDFDLYSLGPAGVDEGGLGDNRLYIPRRK